MKTGIVCSIAAMSILLVGGCVNVGIGNSPETRYFLLTAEAQNLPGPVRAAVAGHGTLGVGPVALPHYLDRPQILTRINDRELLADEFNHWAEPLKASIPRALAKNLRSMTGASQVRIFPWHRSARVSVQVSMEIYRFEADAAGRVTLEATWRIVNASDHRLLKVRQSTITQASTGAAVDEKVKGMSDALLGLSMAIAADLVEIGSLTDPPEPRTPEDCIGTGGVRPAPSTARP